MMHVFSAAALPLDFFWLCFFASHCGFCVLYMRLLHAYVSTVSKDIFPDRAISGTNKKIEKGDKRGLQQERITRE